MGNNKTEVIFLKLSMWKILIFILIISLTPFIYGCSKQSQKPGQSSEQPPKSLTELETNIDLIIDSMDKEWKVKQDQGSGQGASMRESTDVSSQGGQQSSGQGGQQGSPGQGSQQGGQAGSSQGGQQTSQQSSGQGGQQTQNPWEQADKTVKNIHMQWNEFQPEAVKSGVTQDSITIFSTILNNLTNDITNKNLIDTLNDANGLYKFIPEFLSHYKDKSIDVKRLKYFTRDAMYKVRLEKWDLAEASVNQAKLLLPNIRANAKDENKSKYQSLEYSVYDLEKVVKEKQRNLVQLKGNIILENIKAIEKIIKKDEQQLS